VIFIYSMVYPTWAYTYPDTFRVVFNTFLEALYRQTSQEFVLFLGYYDHPPIDVDLGERLVLVQSPIDRQPVLPPYPDRELLNRMRVLPETEKVLNFKYKLDGRKIDKLNKYIRCMWSAGMWAMQQGLDSFWLMRLDSDDILRRDIVAKINGLPPNVGAFYSRRAYILDVANCEFGVYDYRFPIASHAVRCYVVDGRIKNWFLGTVNHTKFDKKACEVGLNCVEEDFAVTILTNTGDNTSYKTTLDSWPNAAWCRPLTLSEDIIGDFNLRNIIDYSRKWSQGQPRRRLFWNDEFGKWKKRK